jgi:hypothetical protein
MLRTGAETALKTDRLTVGAKPVAGAACAAGFEGGGVGAATVINASKAPPKQRMNAKKIRGVEKPDSDAGFFCIGFFYFRCDGNAY